MDDYHNAPLQITTSNKWSCWSADEENWDEDWTKLRQLGEGQTLRICVSSRKECRGGQVDITRLDGSRWHVEGHFTEYWDDVDDLADTLNQVLVEHDDWEKYFFDWDCRSQPVTQLKRYLMEERHYGEAEAAAQALILLPNDPQAFAESIPFSYHAMDPGVDRDFDFEFEGTVDELMARIDQEEDQLIEQSRKEWNDVARLFRPEAQDT